MKRYDFNFDTQSDCMCDVYEDEMGKYVKYSDIKDDRALLEEAVKIFEEIDYQYEFMKKNFKEEIKSFLTRAKERLGLE